MGEVNEITKGMEMVNKDQLCAVSCNNRIKEINNNKKNSRGEIKFFMLHASHLWKSLHTIL